jgi:GntR family transcriptional repressor for pyruvate dehydrogenase complex
MTEGLPRIDVSAREALPSQVARRLLDYILAGTVRPGMKLPSERQLVEALGVGRSVVREALKSLGLLGILEVRQGDGTYVRHLESELLPKVVEWGLLLGEQRTLDLVEARQHIELVTARLAAERRDEADLKAMEEGLDAMQRSRSDAAAFVAADVAFHLAVARAAKNTVLSDVLASVQSLLQVWVTRVIRAAGDSQPSFLEHVPVYKAILAQDATAAVRAMQVHLGAARERLMAALDTEGRSYPANEATA